MSKKSPTAPLPDPQYEIERNIVFSTGHVSKQDATYLEIDARAKSDGPTGSLLVYEYLEGFFIYVSCDDEGSFQSQLDAAERNGYSRAMLKLLWIARAEKCKFLHLDADGPRFRDMPFHSW